MNFQESMDFINADELVEITPKNIRPRKKLLTQNERFRAKKAVERAG
jgi:GTP-binding protein